MQLTKQRRKLTVTRIYTGDDNQSHFEELEIELEDAGPVGHLSKTYPATGIIFRETDGDYDFDWHNAPQRQYIIVLEGMLEVTIGDGTKRVFQAGDVVLAEDTEGQGHISQAVDNKPRKSIFITID